MVRYNEQMKNMNSEPERVCDFLLCNSIKGA